MVQKSTCTEQIDKRTAASHVESTAEFLKGNCRLDIGFLVERQTGWKPDRNVTRLGNISLDRPDTVLATYPSTALRH